MRIPTDNLKLFFEEKWIEKVVCKNAGNSLLESKGGYNLKLKIMMGTMIVLCFAAAVRSRAAERQMNGNGNLNGWIQFYSQDITYLESEIYSLMWECGKELNG